jgi:hypothetical protein
MVSQRLRHNPALAHILSVYSQDIFLNRLFFLFSSDIFKTAGKKQRLPKGGFEIFMEDTPPGIDLA